MDRRNQGSRYEINAPCVHRAGLQKQTGRDLVCMHGLCLGTASMGSACTGDVLQQMNLDASSATELAGIRTGVSCVGCSTCL